MRVICLLVIAFTVGQFRLQGQSFASPKQLVKNGRFAYLISYNYNAKHFGELGIVRGWRSNYDNTQSEMPGQQMLYPYASLSSEFLIGNKTIICPKFGYHIILSFVHVGLSVFDYTDFTENRFGFRPEVGLSLGGVVSVTYGYNLSTHKDSFGISNSTLGIKVIFGSRLLR